MEGFWGVGVGFLLVIVAGLLGGVEGRASAQCVQVGQAVTSRKDRIAANSAFSIGGKKMRPRYPEVLDSFPYGKNYKLQKRFKPQARGDKDFADQTCEQNCYEINIDNPIKTGGGTLMNYPSVDYCTEKMEIRVNAVQQFGVTLRGWLYVEVHFDGEAAKNWVGYWFYHGARNESRPFNGSEYYNKKDKVDELEWIYVQVRDESFNAIGEFVSHGELSEGECSPSDSTLIYPSDHQILPCSATGFREAKTSQALFVAKKRQYNERYKDSGNWTKDEIKNYLPEKNLKKGIYFLWRLNEYWCNKHHKFRIDVTAWSSKNEDTYSTSFDEEEGYAQCWEPYQAQLYYGDPKMYEVFKGYTENHRWKELGVCRIMEKKTGWFMPKWFGAADIRTPGQPLDCKKQIYVAKKVTSGKVPDHSKKWLHENIESVKVREDFAAYEENYLREMDVYEDSKSTEIYTVPNFKSDYEIPTVKGCQVNPFVNKNISGNEQGKNIRTFGGRCEGFVSKKTSNTQYQHCEYNDTLIKDKAKNPQYNFDYENWETYKTYTENLTSGRKLACSVDCVELEDKYLEELGNFPIQASDGNGSTVVVLNQRPVKGKVIVEARRISRETTFWQVRKYHGNLCIFFTMFIIPVSLFVTRYYKETFMHGRCASCPPWLWIHLFMCISVLTLFRSTFSAMRETIYAWGRQVEGNSELHRALGYAFVGMFGLMTAIGGLRPIPRMPRLITCAMHSVVGFVLYLIALGLIMHSPSIPGSPSMDICYENDSVKEMAIKNGTAVTVHKVTIYAVVWLVLDIIFHTFLTIFQVIIDKQTGIERPGFGLPFIPFLPPNSNRDYQGALVRKIVLIVYVIASFIMTVVTMADIFDNDLDNPSGDHKFCKPWNVTTCDIKENPFGCTPLQKQYYQIVIKRYNITWEE